MEWGLVDSALPPAVEADDKAALDALLSEELASPRFEALVEAKHRQRQADEAEQPLASYRAAELERMRLNFFGFDPSYHVARHQFVYKRPKSRTPPYLARHRRVSA